ncbi:ATP-grasp domain-containing protein [Parachitinimonas caeni]|uniref:ATP-grasp domain-containing protein n=1 Tax=Parachitinimonas caeni TaxID=3031301 RepID=A0ABT7E7N4_9NEIS|nr:ATP-grasp domain-containing protein [Parachitinimonas caeni]MDK2126927.1 ATP-grasp domain-containing protein [Parachitinimonas caeni]
MIWFLEGQSSQRDIIQGAQEALPRHLPILASHRQHRPEITSLADTALVEPSHPRQRLDWVLDMAITRQIRVVQVGHSGQVFEPARAAFAAAGIDLVTGGMSARTFDLVNDKSCFTEYARQSGLQVVPAITVHDAEALAAAVDTLRAQQQMVCVKPAQGIFGLGFWRLSDHADPFRCFANADARVVNTRLFIDAYAARTERKPLLVMPYLAGSECSIDLVVEQGQVVAHAGRRKQGLHQHLFRNGPAVELAIAAARVFACDGIVNIQTRDDAAGTPHLLEINPRYSGGIGYTRLAGINLAGIFACRRLGLPPPAIHWQEDVSFKAITLPVPIDRATPTYRAITTSDARPAKPMKEPTPWLN